MSEHTKTPWSWQLPNGKFIGNEPFELDCEDYGTTSSAITAGGKVVCIVPEAHNGEWEDGERHANLLHIVHCVNNHERLAWLLAQIIQDLPANRDWLDPEIEREARALLDEIRKGESSES